jgi:2-desacetyl-2-hydroxyethyl bacteriochlorophyllide A dehydrogenase
MGMMKAVLIEEFGGPEVLVLRDVRRPEPGPREVLVEVAYCGVCRHDLLTRSGAFPSIALPVVLGHQVSGRIAARGSDVGHLVPGQRVMTMIYQSCGACEECAKGETARCSTRRPQFLGEDFDGGYAQYVVVDADMIVPLSDELSLKEAAVITCTYGTAFHALVTRGGARPGQTVLVTGASGGVGLHLLHLARHLGIRTIAVTGSHGKAKLLRDSGASEVLVAQDGKFAAATKAVNGGVGADVVIEIVGGSSLGESIHAVREGGAIVIVGNIEGQPAMIKPAHFILKEISLIGTKSCTKDEVSKICSLVGDGSLAIDLHGVFPLEKAAEVHRLMEEGASRGRFVLEVNAAIN